jgi:hypothetical protein
MIPKVNSALDSKYVLAERKYGYLVDKLRQDVPKSLALMDKPVGKNYQRGFMLASVSAARRAGVSWKRLIDPLTCAYAWFTDTNRVSYIFYTNRSDFFTAYSEDFWKCAYLKIVLEDAAFEALWTHTNPTTTAGEIYPQLTSAITTLKLSLPGWTVQDLRKRVLLEMDAAFLVAKAHGPLTSTGPGRPPYLNKDDTRHIFLE